MKRLMLTAGAVAMMVGTASTALAALRAWEPGDYVQDGLVLHFDGIRNAGADVAHSYNATVWKDLSPSGNDAEFVYLANGGKWLSNAYSFETNGSFQTKSPIDLGSSFTVQTVSKGSAYSHKGNTWPWFVGSDDGHFQFYPNSNKPHVVLNADGMIGGSHRSEFDWTDRRFLTAMMDGNKCLLFESTKNERDWSTGTGPTPLGSQLITIGGPTTNLYKNASDRTVRSARTPYYAVRIYSRILSDDEIAWNRAVDEARFFGSEVLMAKPVAATPAADVVPDAVIATSIAGAEGCERSGAYVVDNEGYTFTALAATVSDTTYVCTGYTIAAWDEAQGAYGAAIAHDGEYSVTVMPGDKVKVTWQWAVASGTMDTPAYVTDGLVLHYDGIWNAGAGLHDNTATTWKDLSETGKNALFYAIGGGTGGWKGNAYHFATNGAFQLASAQDLGTSFTVQTVTECDPAKRANNTWPMLFSNHTTWWQLYIADQTNKRVIQLADNVTGLSGASNRAYHDQWGGRYLTAVLDGRASATFEGTVYPSASPEYRSGAASGWSKDELGSQQWAFGGTPYNGLQDSYRIPRLFTGDYHALRVYSRKLTDAELAKNREVDAARFFGGATPTNGAVAVRSQFAGLSGREPDGCYFPNAWTFSASSGLQTARGLEWRCSGYTLETWDVANGRWSKPVSSANITYTSPSGSSYPSVRLTWLWTPVSGIRSAADYDTGDYIAAGLSVQLDGIRNAGSDRGHDPSATSWADLSPNADRATFTQRVAADGSGWNSAGDGYYFGGRTYAQMATSLPATPTVTLELFGRFVGSDQNDGRTGDYFPNYISGLSDFCVFTFKTGNELRWKTDPYNGSSGADSRPYLSSWKGRNFSAALGLETMVSYEDGVAKASKPRTAVKTIPATKWMVANGQGNLGTDYSRQAFGTVNAVRVYDRQLSAEEVAWNHKVDAARFDGTLASANVVVAGKYDDYEGEAAGEYEVFGSHAFTAGAATDEKGKVRPLVGYTIATWNGSAWSAPVAYSDTSYVYTVGSSPAKVRLTWKWLPDGLVITFR